MIKIGDSEKLSPIFLPKKADYNNCDQKNHDCEGSMPFIPGDAVFIMTPDHLHASVAVAAMNKGLMLAAHKPVDFYYVH
jgi:hypothetical protein